MPEACQFSANHDQSQSDSTIGALQSHVSVRYMYLQGKESDVKSWDEETTAITDAKVNNLKKNSGVGYRLRNQPVTISEVHSWILQFKLYMVIVFYTWVDFHKMVDLKSSVSTNMFSPYQLRKHDQFYFNPSIVVNELRTSWFCHERTKCQFPVLKWI